jgi:hypothetical protein
MFNRVLACVCIVSLSAASASASPGGIDSDASAWWAEATHAFGESRTLSATRTSIRAEELAEDGTVQSYESGETVTEWVGTEARVSVVRAEKNGKDVSDEWRKRYAKSRRDSSGSGVGGSQDGRSRGGPPEGFDATPFDPKYTNDVVLGAASRRNGLVEVPYTIKTSVGLVEGVAYFSPEGVVESASQQWMEPPMFVSSMKSTLEYAYQDGALVIGGMRIEAQASILVVKKRFRMVFEFSGWRQAPAQ